MTYFVFHRTDKSYPWVPLTDYSGESLHDVLGMMRRMKSLGDYSIGTLDDRPPYSGESLRTVPTQAVKPGRRTSLTLKANEHGDDSGISD